MTASIIIGAIGSALQGAGTAAGAGQNYETAFMSNQMENARQNQRIALSESAMDPFRQQMYQAGDLSALGMMTQNNNKPGVSAPTGRYASSAPTIAPQTYQPSPELMQWLTAIQQNVAGGQNRAPSISGWGGSSTLDLTDPAVLADPRKAKGPAQTRPPAPGGAQGAADPSGYGYQ